MNKLVFDDDAEEDFFRMVNMYVNILAVGNETDFEVSNFGENKGQEVVRNHANLEKKNYGPLGVTYFWKT